MAATEQELAAINANTEAINQILNEAESIGDHSEMVVLDATAFALVQKGTDTPLKLSIQKIIDASNNPVTPGSEGDVMLNIGGTLGAVSSFNYDSDTNILTIPMSLSTRGTTSDIPYQTYDFESGDLTGFTSDGDAVWTVDGVDPFSGSFSARSGVIGTKAVSNLKLNQNVGVELTSGTLTPGVRYIINSYVATDDFSNVGAGTNETGEIFVATGDTPTDWTNGSGLTNLDNTITFQYKVSSEQDFDFLEFYIDDELVASFSGEIPYTLAEFYVKAGTHDFKWTYWKDDAGSGGSDLVRIDDIEFSQLITSTELNGLTYSTGMNVFTRPIVLQRGIQGELISTGDATINGVTVGEGAANQYLSVVVGSKTPNITDNTSRNSLIGKNIADNAEDFKRNTGFGFRAFKDVIDTERSIAIGYNASEGAESTNNSILIGVKDVSNGDTPWPTNLDDHFIVFHRDSILLQRNNLGEFTAPLLTIPLINSGGLKSLATKEYVDATSGGIGFQANQGQVKLNGTESISGLLIIGQKYAITNYIATDDFTNVGASSNVTGEIFTATGTTPTDWTNGSTLQRRPTLVLASNVEQRIDYFTDPLSLSSSPTTEFPQNIVSPTDSDLWKTATSTLIENTVPGQAHWWRFIFDYSGKSINNNTGLELKLRNILSGFEGKSQITLPSGETNNNNFIATIITIADGASLPSPFGTGQGYQLWIESTSGITFELTSVTRISVQHFDRT